MFPASAANLIFYSAQQVTPLSLVHNIIMARSRPPGAFRLLSEPLGMLVPSGERRHAAKEITVATFVLIHGGGDVGWYWHLVEQELRRRGHDTLAPDLPCDDDSAGLAEYADTVVKAIGGRRGLIVAAQSFGGFTAPLVAAQIPVDMLVLVAGMIPAPGEAPEDWPADTGFDEVMRQQARRYSGQDLIYHDVPPALAEQARRNARDQSDTPGRAVWPLEAWPPVPTRFVLCTADRFFPPEFMRRVVADRLGIVPDEIDAGHAVALSRPKELSDLLASYSAPGGH